MLLLSELFAERNLDKPVHRKVIIELVVVVNKAQQ